MENSEESFVKYSHVYSVLIWYCFCYRHVQINHLCT